MTQLSKHYTVRHEIIDGHIVEFSTDPTTSQFIVVYPNCFSAENGVIIAKHPRESASFSIWAAGLTSLDDSLNLSTAIAVAVKLAKERFDKL